MDMEVHIKKKNEYLYVKPRGNKRIFKKSFKPVIKLIKTNKKEETPNHFLINIKERYVPILPIQLSGREELSIKKLLVERLKKLSSFSQLNK